MADLLVRLDRWVEQIHDADHVTWEGDEFLALEADLRSAIAEIWRHRQRGRVQAMTDYPLCPKCSYTCPYCGSESEPIGHRLYELYGYDGAVKCKKCDVRGAIYSDGGHTHVFWESPRHD